MGKGVYKFLLVFTLFLLAYTPLPVAAQQHKYRHITPDDGLPSTTVYRIMQDTRGFIWIATDAGVCRYDGNKFQTFTMKDGLPDNEILNLYEDHQGNIWFYTFKREPCYYYNDSIIKFNPEHFFDGTLLLGMAQDNDGNYWFATDTKGLMKYNAGKCTYYNRNNCLPNNYTKLTQNKKGNIWISTFNHVAPLYKEPGNFSPIVEKGVWGDQVYTPHLTNDDGKLFGCFNSKLMWIMPDTAIPVLTSDIAGKKMFVMSVTEDNSRNLLVGTSKGAYRISIGDLSIKDYFKPRQAINFAIEDREHNLWFATLNDGIYFLSKASQQVKNYYSILDDNQTQISKIIGDSIDNHLYLSSQAGTLFNFNKDSLSAIEFPDPGKYSNLGNYVMDNNNVMWCSSTFGAVTFSNGNISTHKINPMLIGDFMSGELIGKDIWIDKRVNVIGTGSGKAMALGANNDIWVSSFCGVFRIQQNMDPKRYLLKQYTRMRTSSICYDHSGKVWIGTLKGLAYLLNDTVAYVSKTGTETIDAINDIKVDNNNVLWIATSGEGIYSYKDGILEHVTTDNGLSSNLIYKLCLYKNYILAATKQGVCKINLDPKSKVLSSFPLQINDGLASREVNDIYKANGLVYVATNTGLSVFNENEMLPDTSSIPVYFTRLSVNEKDTALTSKLVLPYDKNSIRLEYIGLSFHSGKDIIYHYRMEGLDTSWNETRFTNIQYPTLPPGKYTFIVDSRSLQGEWSGHPATMSIIINAPYWQTWWFRILVGLLFVSIVAGIAYAVFNYYRNRNEVTKKLVLLEGQALRAQMNPHFIFNSLNAIHDFIADHDQRSAHLYLSRFAALIRRTLDLSRKHSVSLYEELETLKLYLELEVMRFKGKIEYDIAVDTNDEPSELLLPAMLLQPYLENAIRHGLMNKEGKGQLKLKILQRGEKLICTISDNGIGRKAAGLGGKNIRGHRSHAMDITGERMNIFNEKGQPVKAEVRIIDLEDNEGNALGTKVELTIPLNHS